MNPTISGRRWRWLAGLALSAGGLVAMGAPAASARTVDVAVERVTVSAAATEAGQRVTVSALVRRHLQPNAPAPPGPVDVEVELGLAQEPRPFARRRVSLGPGQAATVEAAWVAQVGLHQFRVRIARVTVQGQTVKDDNPGNDEGVSRPPLVVRAPGPSLARPPALPAPGSPPPPSREPGPARPEPALPLPEPPAPAAGAIAGVLTVPAEPDARYRVVLEGPGGLRQTLEVPGPGERRVYRFGPLPPGSYRVHPEAAPEVPGSPAPAGRWAPRRDLVTLGPGERREGLRGLDFRFESTSPATRVPVPPGASGVPLPRPEALLALLPRVAGPGDARIEPIEGDAPVTPAPPATRAATDVLPDLVIRRVDWIESGAERGRVRIWFGVNHVRGRIPPEGAFAYRVVAVSDRDTWHGATGIARVRSLFFDWGDVVLTGFELSELETWRVHVSILNGPGFRGESREEGWTDYAESDYENNLAVTVLGRTPSWDGILDARVASRGEDWARIDVRYVLQTHRTGRLGLVVSDGGAADVVPCRTAGGETTPAVPLGVNQVARFLCHRPPTSAMRGTRADATLRDAIARELGTGEPPTPPLAEGSFPVRLNWVRLRDGHLSTLPDLVGRFADVALGPYGRGGTVTVAVQNVGGAPAPSSRASLHLGGRGDTTTLSFDVPPLAPGATLTHTLALRLGFRAADARAALTVDRGDTVFEADEANNQVEKLLSVWPRGPIRLGPARVAAARAQDFQRGGCPRAEGGHAWPGELGSPAAGEVLVGFRAEYEGRPCWRRWEFYSEGFVTFDLDRLPAESLLRAELSFRRLRSAAPTARRCPGETPAAVLEAGPDWSVSPSRGDTRPPAGLSTGGDAFRLDVTDRVRAWLDGSRPNHGLRLASRRGNVEWTGNCAAYFGDFALTVHLAE